MTINREEQSGVAIVRLARPDKRNALTRDMLERLREVFDAFRERDDLRAVVLTGEGDSFSAGTDITGLAALSETEARKASSAVTVSPASIMARARAPPAARASFCVPP